VLKDGYIMQVGSPLELYNRPQNRFVAGFIGSPHMNFFKGRMLEGTRAVEIDGQRVELDGPVEGLAEGQEIEIGLRPEHMQMEAREGAAELAGIEVDLLESLGGQTMIYGHTASGHRLIMAETGQIRAEGTIAARFSTANLHFFDESGQAYRVREAETA